MEGFYWEIDALLAYFDWASFTHLDGHREDTTSTGRSTARCRIDIQRPPPRYVAAMEGFHWEIDAIRHLLGCINFADLDGHREDTTCTPITQKHLDGFNKMKKPSDKQ